MGQQLVLSEGIFWFSLLLYAVSYIIHKSILLCIVSPMRVPQIWLKLYHLFTKPSSLISSSAYFGLSRNPDHVLKILRNTEKSTEPRKVNGDMKRLQTVWQKLQSFKVTKNDTLVENSHNHTYIGPLYMHISQKLLKISPWNFVCFLRCIDVHFLQISSHSGVVKLEPVVERTWNDQITPFRSYIFCYIWIVPSFHV